MGNIDSGERSFRCCSKCSSKPRLEKTVDRRRRRMLAWKRRRRSLILAWKRRRRRLRKRGWTYSGVQTAVERILGWKLWDDDGGQTAECEKRAVFQVSLPPGSSTNENAGCKRILLLRRDS